MNALRATHILLWTLLLAATPVFAPAAPVKPAVVAGLEIAPAGGLRVKVGPGECLVAGRKVEVRQPVVLELDPVTIVTVRNEKCTLVAEKPQGWARGTRLEQCKSRGTTLPGCLVPGSVVVKTAPDGEPCRQGQDYLVDETWGMLGRVEGRRIGPDTEVYVDYAYSLMRLDTIQVSPQGEVSVRKGAEAKTCPHPAGADAGSLALANVFLHYNLTELTGLDVFPIGPPLAPPTAEELEKKAERVAKARAKLAGGGKLRIGFWGDSVTCGGDASRPETRFPDGFVLELRKRFPQAEIEFFNAGIGGSSTLGRLPNFHQDVIEKKPDLVIVEFVNDMGFSPSMMRDHYDRAIDQVRAIGGEVILITPHFTMPAMMGFENVWGEDHRAACQALREIADQKQVGLADAARVWGHLAKEGIPYTTLLYNGINHPDDRGHRIFIDQLLQFFEPPAEPKEQAGSAERFPAGITATFSIVAADPETRICGAAVASKYPAVGEVVPYVRAGVGAFCTQHWHNPEWGEKALDLLAEGKLPEEVLGELLRDDPQRDKRQLAIIDVEGRAANRNPARPDPSGVYWGAMSGRYYACQGNTLTGRRVITAMAQAYEETKGSLADRLMAALVAGDRAGGDHRGRLAAGIRVAKPGVDGCWLELQVDKSDDAVTELAKKYLDLDHPAKGEWPGPEPK
jgi:uncharacterized Ntn-hydrolase superfamily protein/lysophospholipase L1-like esterase